MSTTLVNVGILNGRSTKLNTDDLTVLGDIVENYSTDVLVSTPEIIIPEFEAEAARSVDAVEDVDTDVEYLAEDLAAQTHVIDEAALIESLRFDGGTTEGGSHIDLQVEQRGEVVSDSEAKSNEASAIEASAIEESAIDEAEATTGTQDDSTVEQLSIKRAKQAAIEAAFLAAANRTALAQSPLIQPPANSESNTAVESDASPEDFEDSNTDSDDANVLEMSPVRRAVDRLRRENIAVEEITSELLDRMGAAPDELNVAAQTNEKSVAILTPTEKQFDRLVENLLEKTVPGMPAVMMIAGCEISPRTGKVASGVAALLAEKNLGKILLVDGDMFDKTLTDSLINSHEPGLIEVLNRQESLESTILPTGLQNMYFLPAGIANLSREKTMAGRMAALNQQLRESFRFVLIDGGNSSEPVCRTFSSFCDSTYLAISLGHTFCATAAAAVEDLQAAGSRLLGTIVTK